MERRKLLEQALYILYVDPSPDQKKEADEWLKNFQHSMEAWQICDQILTESMEVLGKGGNLYPLYMTFFAAQTLQTKIRHDFRELPDDSAAQSLQQSVLNHLLHTRNHPGKVTHTIRTQLCIGMVCLMIQRESWDTNLVSYLIQNIGYQYGTSNVQSTGHTLDGGLTLLELLIYIPQEAYDFPLVSDQRYQNVISLMEESIPILFQLVDRIFQHALTITDSSLSFQIQSMCLKCFESWISYCTSKKVSSDLIIDCQLTKFVFDALNDPNLFDQSVNLLCEIFINYNDIQRDIALLQFLIPQVLNLKTRYMKLIQEEDFETAQGLTLVLCEMMTSCLSFIFSDIECHQTELLELLLYAMNFPDFEIVGKTLNFWYDFTQALDEIEIKSHQHHQIQKYHQCLMHLTQACISILRYPSEFMEWNKDRRDDFKEHREEIGDILRNCCKLLGSNNLLQYNMERLQEGVQKKMNVSWEVFEAHLYSIRSISREMDASSISMLIQLFQMILDFPEHPSIRYTSTLIINRHCNLLIQAPSLIDPIFQYIQKGLFYRQDMEWKISSAAAMALRSLCKDMSTHVGNAALSINDKLNVLSVDDHLIVLEGFCYMFSNCDVEQMISGLQMLIHPIVNSLNQLLKSENTSSSALVSNELLRLMCILEHTNLSTRSENHVNHPFNLLIDALWPIFEKILNLFRNYDMVIENVCRCFKRLMRKKSFDFQPFVGKLIALLIQCYMTCPKSSFLYCGSICTSEYGTKNYDSNHTISQVILEKLSTPTFLLLQNAENIANLPDIIEEFHFLLIRYVNDFPYDIIHLGLLETTLECALACLQVRHMGANKSVLKYFDALLGTILSENKIKPSNFQQYHEMFQLQMHEKGEKIIALMILLIIQGVPSQLIENDRGSITNTICKYRRAYPTQFHIWIQNIFSKCIHGEMKQELLEKLKTCEETRDFRRLLYRLSQCTFSS